MDRWRLSPRVATALDVLIALAVGVIGCWRELSQQPDVLRLVPAPVGVFVGVQVIGAVALLWRRQRPVAIGGLAAALCLITPLQSATVAAYSAAVHTEHRQRAAVVIGAVTVCFCLGGQIWLLDDPVSGVLAVAFAAVLGLYVRARRGLYDALIERGDRAEREQQLRAEHAVARERARLASEMHDVVSHRLSLMLLHAGALTATSSDPAVRRSVEELRANGVSALTELREVFGVLRTSAALSTFGPASSPDLVRPATDGAPSLEDLVSEWLVAGADVTLVESGCAGVLVPAVRRTVYRIAQEALTNAAKHSPGSQVQVAAEYDDRGVRMSITNSASQRAVAGTALLAAGSGSGLAGLAERVELVGGSLRSGWTDDGGYEVSAWLPAVVPQAEPTW